MFAFGKEEIYLQQGISIFHEVKYLSSDLLNISLLKAYFSSMKLNIYLSVGHIYLREAKGEYHVYWYCYWECC